MKKESKYQEIQRRLSIIKPIFEAHCITISTEYSAGNLYMFRVNSKRNFERLAHNIEECLNVLPGLEQEAKNL